MACACKNKSNQQPAAVKQVVKKQLTPEEYKRRREAGKALIAKRREAIRRPI
jgi:hypothetical protein